MCAMLQTQASTRTHTETLTHSYRQAHAHRDYLQWHQASCAEVKGIVAVGLAWTRRCLAAAFLSLALDLAAPRFLRPSLANLLIHS